MTARAKLPTISQLADERIAMEAGVTEAEILEARRLGINPLRVAEMKARPAAKLERVGPGVSDEEVARGITKKEDEMGTKAKTTKAQTVDAEILERRARKNGYGRLCGVAEQAALAAGFKPSIERNAKGHWKLVTSWCRENGIDHPAIRKVTSAPTAAEVAAAKREARLAQKRAAAKARRERIRPRRAGRRRGPGRPATERPSWERSPRQPRCGTSRAADRLRTE